MNRPNKSGVRVAKEDFSWPCDVCRRSTQPGWLWLGGGDWAECPQCAGTGKITGTLTERVPTRKIMLPQRVGVRRVSI